MDSYHQQKEEPLGYNGSILHMDFYPQTFTFPSNINLIDRWIYYISWIISKEPEHNLDSETKQQISRSRNFLIKKDQPIKKDNSGGKPKCSI